MYMCRCFNTNLNTNSNRKGKLFLLTVTCPFGVSGGSHVMTIVDELNGRTCTFRGALSISVQNKKNICCC